MQQEDSTLLLGRTPNCSLRKPLPHRHLQPPSRHNLHHAGRKTVGTWTFSLETGNLAPSTWLVHLAVNTAGTVRPLVRQVVRSEKTIENIEKLAGEPVSQNLRAHLCFQ